MSYHNTLIIVSECSLFTRHDKYIHTRDITKNTVGFIFPHTAMSGAFVFLQRKKLIKNLQSSRQNQICPGNPHFGTISRYTDKFTWNVIVVETLMDFHKTLQFIPGEGKKHTLAFGGGQCINSDSFGNKIV